MMHTLERYFIPNTRNQMTDEIAEGVLRVVIENGKKGLENPTDYQTITAPGQKLCGQEAFPIMV